MRVEIASLALVGVALMAVLSRYEMFEEFYQFSRTHENWELDEVFIAIPVLTVLIGLFAVNRLLQLRRETAMRQKLEHKLLQELTTNRQTGLPNEQVFFGQVDSALVSAGALACGSIAVIRTNARFALKDTAKAPQLSAIMAELVARCRSTLPAGTILASMDNDTLLAFVPEDVRAGQGVLERLASLLVVPVSTGEGQIYLTARIGAALIRGRSVGASARPAREDLELALACAVHALEATPVHNNMAVAFHDRAMERREQERKALAARVEAIIDNDAFDCAFQPIVTLADGKTTGSEKTTGFEILARWPQGHGAPVAPDVFVPLIEDAGRIDQFTEQMLDRALRALRQWPAEIGVSVNVARSQLRQSTFATRIIHKLQMAGVAPHRLTLEITETHELTDVALSQVSVRQLRGAGVRIAIDDFGAGYANLNLLHDIDFDMVKIDRKIIVDMIANPKDQAIVRAMVAMTDLINVGLIAEGVEDSKTVAMLRKLGVSRAQGYLFARPMSEAATLEWIEGGVKRRTADKAITAVLQIA